MRHPQTDRRGRDSADRRIVSCAHSPQAVAAMLNARVDERQSTTAATIAPESPNRRRRCSCSGWAHAIGPRPGNRVTVVGNHLQLTVYNPGGAPGRIPTLYWAPLPWVEPVDHCALSGPVTVSTAFVTRSFHTVMTCVGATATTLF